MRPSTRDAPQLQALVGEVMRDAAELVMRELDLFRAEMRASVRQALYGAVAFIGAAVFLITALALFADAGVKALAARMGSEVLAALTVGGAALLVGLLLAFFGYRALSFSTFKPRRTVRSIRRDKEMLAEKVAP
jgi:hypothetical protein